MIMNITGTYMRKWLLPLCLLLCCADTSASAQMDTILNRYTEYLFRTSTVPDGKVEAWMQAVTPAGQWPDILYNDNELAGWKVSHHLMRIREMSLAWCYPGSQWYGNRQLWEKINLALDHWTKYRYQSANWWHNEIGVPRYMRDIIILLRHHLEPQRLQQALAVMAQLRVHDNYVGGNLVWCADLGLHYGALTNDAALVKRCRDLILKEITITTGEGVQPDYSFHQHSKRLQMYQYGKAFLEESMRIAWQLRGGPLAFPQEKVTILTDFVLKGWQWMARGIHTVPGTMDRSASRKNELRSADLRPLLPLMMELEPQRKAELEQTFRIQNGNGSLVGYRYYPYSDFAVYHRPGFSFFLKTISARTYATEHINRENLKGKLLHSGDAYLIRNGEEYYNLLPLWDWTALPGVTLFANAHVAERRQYAGGVSNGSIGFSAMDYALKDSVGAAGISARKFWACYGDVVVCLVANLQAKNLHEPVYTALDQCRLQGPVWVNHEMQELPMGDHHLQNVQWIYHAGFAYIPAQPSTIDLQLKSVSGSWTTINASEITTPLQDKILLPVLRHGSLPASFAYALAYAKSAKDAKKLSAKPTWQILQNDSVCQAVSFPDGTVMAAFYAAGKIEAGKKTQVQVNQPCLILLQKDKLYVSDPKHSGSSVTITINDTSLVLTLPADGTTVEKQVQQEK